MIECKCDGCGESPARELHTCPYDEEVNDDHEKLCNCCEECEGQCADDI